MRNKLNHTVVVGMQWGDEGKGKIIDLLSKSAGYVIRFNGGNNAGHTVVVKDRTFKFHLLPSGAVSGKKLRIAQGTVINPKILLEEIEFLKEKGFNPDLKIDPRVHIVMPYHFAMDEASENYKGKNATGSLKLGIGYCYEDKNNRTGIRFEDLLDKNILENKLKSIVPFKRKFLDKVYGKKSGFTVKAILKEYAEYGRKLAKYKGDVAMELWNLPDKAAVLYETAHGTFLDPAFGTYPYTVAPHAIAGSVFSGSGIGPRAMNVVGVVKAYTTRVGNGPFPTEQKNAVGVYLQQKGFEVGTTSGRKRRCGWLDLVMLRTAVKLNNVTSLAITKLDVLTGLPEINVAVNYASKKGKTAYFPSEMNHFAEFEPEYKSFSGWIENIADIRKFDKLPVNCRTFIKFIGRELDVPVTLVSVGSERSEIIKLN